MAKFLRVYVEPAQQLPVVAEVGVLVAGGGPAGIAAAIAASRMGARTLLVERYGYLGGMITGAHVVAILGVGDGRRPLARGMVADLRSRLAPYGAVTVSERNRPGGEGTREGSGDYLVDAETLKWQAAEWLLKEGAELLLHTLVCAPWLEGGQVVGVITESKSGRQAIRARVVVDATADADLAFRAGCPCDDQTHEITLGIRLTDVDKEKTAAFAQQDPEVYRAICEETERLGGGALLGNMRLMKGIDVADAADLSRAEITLRREYFAGLQYLRQHLPGYESARIAETYPQLGVRQGRRIHGAYCLTNDDLKSSRRFDDGIARLGVYFPDWGPIYAIHGLRYDIPYRCLVPEGVEGLLVAGRCISADYQACNTMRLIVPCLATGQAAGAAAALAVAHGLTPRHVPPENLRRALLAQGVFLG